MTVIGLWLCSFARLFLSIGGVRANRAGVTMAAVHRLAENGADAADAYGPLLEDANHC